ncbi:MAG TPA: 30S ribosomal protein S8 [Candidatus Aenigmarchaeota archaeon]|nr:30S ribosomal protein S8 [Candidatus Aenigmarchaeota archaeon]
MRHDLIADVFSAIKNADRIGKKEVVIGSSNLIKNILNILKDKGYIQDYEILIRNNYQELKAKLKNKINELKVVKPRHAFKKNQIIKFKERYLPGDGVGYLIVSTSKSKITTDRDLKDEGGIIIGYVY